MMRSPRGWYVSVSALALLSLGGCSAAPWRTSWKANAKRKAQAWL